MAKPNSYAQIVSLIFERHYKRGATRLPFGRDELSEAARELGVPVPKNLGDVVYSVRYRQGLPETVSKTAKKGYEWEIVPAGRSKYAFELVRALSITPNPSLAKTKIPDATPGMVSRYALSDEQALLAKIRYNRLIDIFSATTCYSLQNHLRTSVKDIGQIETDEIYVGVDKRGAHYVYPVQAKGGRDSINGVQIKQDLAMCEEKYPSLICRSIAAQFMADDTIALFELQQDNDGISIVAEKHYLLVPPEELTSKELDRYSRVSLD